MRTFTRFGAATAAVALASAAALAGAGAAAAADEPPEFDSDSTLEVGWVDGDLQVEFDNNSGRDLVCLFTISTEQMVGAYEDFLRSGVVLEVNFDVDGNFDGVRHYPPTPNELIEMLDDAIAAQQAGSYLITTAADASGPVDASDIDVFHPVTDRDFELAAIAVCGTDGVDDVLVETHYPESGDSGSLENIFGSATGSLGSLGS